MMEIKDLENDLEDGRCLLNLLEVISSKSIGLPSKNPKTKFQKVENLNKSLNFIAGEGVKLVGIGAEDIFDHKLKLILGMIWTLILRFHINMGEGSPKWELLQWVRQQVKPYAVDEPNNFTKDWMNGKVLFALVDSIEPGIISPKDLSSMTGNPGDDVEKAMQTAKDSYRIPRILDVTDMTESPDELAMMTYVSYFREYLGDEARRKREEQARLARTADAAHCFADGPGLEKAETHQPAEFCIHARNCFDAELDPKHGGDAFKVEIVRDGAEVKPTMKDNGDGNYPVTYVASIPGAYEVRITLEGGAIKGSPYKLTVYGPSAMNTKVSGPGVEGARVGTDAPILIEAFDQDGKRVTSGGDKFAVNVDGPQPLGSVPVKDNGDGTHSSGYKVDKPGRYNVAVSVRDEPVNGSPFSVLIENGNAGKSWADGPGLEGGKTDHDQKFTIHSVDADGNPAKSGGDPFVVKISGAADVEAKVADNGNGTYDVTYNPEEPGDYQVAVTLHDQPIKDAPFSVSIKTSPSAGNSWAEGDGLVKGQEDKPSEFKIHAVDKKGQALTAGGDGDEFTVKAKGPNGEVPVELKDNGDGTYDCSYTPNAPGEYEVNVNFGDKPIKDMPCKFSVKAAPCPPKSYAEGPGVVECVDNEAAVFTIYLLDKEGNRRVDGGDNVKVDVTGVPLQAEVKVTDNNDGTYSVEYLADEPGQVTVAVTCDGEHIKDSPFAVPCKEGTDASNCGFGQFTFTVQSADRRGKPKTFGGDKFAVSVKNKEDPDAEAEAEGVDNGDGTYTAKYSLSGQGTFFISVSLNGKQIKGSPFKQKL